MRKSIALLATIALACVFFTGCAQTQKKLSRGLANSLEIVRLGELQRSMEQSAFFESPTGGNGFVGGVCKTVARTSVGLYEVVTCPFPSYDPIFTNYLTPRPQYPDSQISLILDDSMFDADTYVGFSGGNEMPLAPGNRFAVLPAH